MFQKESSTHPLCLPLCLCAKFYMFVFFFLWSFPLLQRHKTSTEVCGVRTDSTLLICGNCSTMFKWLTRLHGTTSFCSQKKKKIPHATKTFPCLHQSIQFWHFDKMTKTSLTQTLNYWNFLEYLPSFIFALYMASLKHANEYIMDFHTQTCVVSSILILCSGLTQTSKPFYCVAVINLGAD